MNFQELNQYNSTIVIFKGKEYRTIQNPYATDDKNFYIAHALDENNEEHEIAWLITHEDYKNLEDETLACDWDNPYSVISCISPIDKLEKICEEYANLTTSSFNVFVESKDHFRVIEYLKKLSNDDLILKSDIEKIKAIDHDRHIIAVIARADYKWQANKIVNSFMNNDYICTKMLLPLTNEYVAIVSIVPPENNMIKN
ncbi:hypothetical protein [Bacillus pumilus]|uniref:Uncharacterized protein n=1 Tax=Bacillus pumilus TaxID=1408 RepID=A0A2G8IXW5_BACPU|nr:hypothetical protein [Bacillus pumilus]PIK28338.1 hypothetical protein CTV99_03200 [Bacillus pumilus]